MTEDAIRRHRERAQHAYARAISRLGQKYREACNVWHRAYEEGR